MSDLATVEPIHLCSVPADQLPALAGRGFVVDTGRIEFGRRITGSLLAAKRRGDEIVGSIEIWVCTRRAPSYDGPTHEQVVVPTGFALRAGERATAHLPTSVLATTDGAYDIEAERAAGPALGYCTDRAAQTASQETR